MPIQVKPQSSEIGSTMRFAINARAVSVGSSGFHPHRLTASAPHRIINADPASKVTLKNLNGLCKRNGWLTGRTGHFSPGNAPANKGKSMPFNANSAATRFQKGTRTGRANALYKPIGTERITEDGCSATLIASG